MPLSCPSPNTFRVILRLLEGHPLAPPAPFSLNVQVTARMHCSVKLFLHVSAYWQLFQTRQGPSHAFSSFFLASTDTSVHNVCIFTSRNQGVAQFICHDSSRQKKKRETALLPLTHMLNSFVCRRVAPPTSLRGWFQCAHHRRFLLTRRTSLSPLQ